MPFCGGLWSFAVVCGSLGWFAMVCGGLSYSHTAMMAYRNYPASARSMDYQVQDPGTHPRRIDISRRS